MKGKVFEHSLQSSDKVGFKKKKKGAIWVTSLSSTKFQGKQKNKTKQNKTKQNKTKQLF